MTEWLKVRIVLEENQDSIPALTTIHNPSPGDPMPSSDLYGHQVYTHGTQVYMQQKNK